MLRHVLQTVYYIQKEPSCIIACIVMWVLCITSTILFYLGNHLEAASPCIILTVLVSSLSILSVYFETVDHVHH